MGASLMALGAVWAGALAVRSAATIGPDNTQLEGCAGRGHSNKGPNRIRRLRNRGQGRSRPARLARITHLPHWLKLALVKQSRRWQRMHMHQNQTVDNSRSHQRGKTRRRNESRRRRRRSRARADIGADHTVAGKRDNKGTHESTTTAETMGRTDAGGRDMGPEPRGHEDNDT